MKKLKTTKANLIILFAVAIFFFGCHQKPKNVTEDIVTANLKFTEAFNNGDTATLAKYYTSDAKLFPPNSKEIEGQKAIEVFWKAVMDMGIKKAELETVSAGSCGDYALEEGHYKLYAEGDQMVDQGKYIVTWKKENGQWKLYRDIWNTSNPSPEKTRSLIEKYVGYWNTGDFQGIEEVLHPDFEIRMTPDFKPEKGIETFKKNVVKWRTTYPDFHIDVNEWIFANDKFAGLWTITATHTGKHINVTGMSIIHFQEGKIKDEWIASNNLLWMTQLGYKIIPPGKKSDH